MCCIPWCVALLLCVSFFVCVWGRCGHSSHLESLQWYSCYRTGQARTDQHRVLLAVVVVDVVGAVAVIYFRCFCNY